MSALRRVAVPLLDPQTLYDVEVGEGVFTRIEAVADRDVRAGGEPELWPGFVEAHAHLALPANFDDSLDDARISALSYLFHGVTHVVDMFGFPLVADAWEAGRATSPVPYPRLAHCGYAATSMRDGEGLTGHGVEFPAPVFMLGVGDDLEPLITANRARGATFLKVMFTDGTEQPGTARRFSRLPAPVLEHVARVVHAHGLPAILDCNTREEVLQAYAYGFRLFAHPVRDLELTAQDWHALEGARFISTLGGLYPMVMEREDFRREYGRPGFRETQDPANLDFVAGVEEPFGIRFGCQDTRTAALATMRANSLRALSRRGMLVGTDCGNTGAFHGYSLLGELDRLAGDDPRERAALRHGLLRAATLDNRLFFDEVSGSAPSPDLLHEGAPATFNLLPAAAKEEPLSTLPELTVAAGVVVDRQAVAQEIRSLRATPSGGKVGLHHDERSDS
ncbi:hydrolase [Streptomyces sp. PA03-1a]|nr:hydrolase [Streptomyces sp. PA03-1a]